MSKQREKIGALFAIDLGDKKIAFGRKINSEESIFYDYLAPEISSESIQNAYSSKVAFRVPVMKHAVTSGRWKLVDASESISPELAAPHKYFMQDRMTGKLSIYLAGSITRCEAEDIANLECAAVWEPEHIEDRLRDHFSGISNKWFESLKAKL